MPASEVTPVLSTCGPSHLQSRGWQQSICFHEKSFACLLASVLNKNTHSGTCLVMRHQAQSSTSKPETGDASPSPEAETVLQHTRNRDNTWIFTPCSLLNRQDLTALTQSCSLSQIPGYTVIHDLFIKYQLSDSLPSNLRTYKRSLNPYFSN